MSSPDSASSAPADQANRRAARFSPGLYALLDVEVAASEDSQELVRRALAAFDGGACLLQYRDKNATPAERGRRAAVLAQACRQEGRPLIINDDPHLALAVGAAGVHLGRDDAPLAQARALLGEGALIGVSCYADERRARSFASLGADYVAIGAVFPSGTKPEASPASLELIERLCRQLSVPVCAIGGIDDRRAGRVARTGVRLLAVAGGLFGGNAGPDEVRRRAQRLSRLFAEAAGPSPGKTGKIQD